MKAILEFDFDADNDDRSDFNDAVNGYKWKLAMWDVDQELRKKTKYASDNDDPVAVEALYKFREEVRQILFNYNLSLDD